MVVQEGRFLAEHSDACLKQGKMTDFKTQSLDKSHRAQIQREKKESLSTTARKNKNRWCRQDKV